MIPTQDPEYFIRAAEVDDVPLVLEFIKELGEYEKLSDQVQATDELLSESLFGESPYAEVLLGFYRSLGVEAMTAWTVQRVSGEDLKKLASAFSGS